MNSTEVDKARKRLEDDLESNPHTLSAPLAHGVTRGKILRYIFNCIMANVPKADCLDWLYILYDGQNEEEKEQFISLIDFAAGALYDFNDYSTQHK